VVTQPGICRAVEVKPLDLARLIKLNSNRLRLYDAVLCRSCQAVLIIGFV